MTAWIAVLPQLISLLIEIIKWVKQYKEGDPAQEIAKITDAIKQVKEAKSAEDRRAAARSLSRIINGM